MEKNEQFPGNLSTFNKEKLENLISSLVKNKVNSGLSG